MPKGRHISLDYVVDHCEAVSNKHKVMAMHEAKTAFGSLKDQKKRDEYLAKAQITDLLATHFRNASADFLQADPRIEPMAREIDPEAFSSYDAIIARLTDEGSDSSYAVQIAESTYGERLADARSKASEAIELDSATPDVADPYAAGVDDAVAWLERRAAEAEIMENGAVVREHKIKYGQRAKRYRLYARHMKAELSEAREAVAARRRRDADREIQPTLPFARSRVEATGDGGIPLEVQMRFLKKTEVMDDEGF